MPLDVLGRTRATLTGPASTSPWPRGLGNLVKPCRAGDRALQLLLFNEECLVGTSHQLVPITSLPFVHTARRYYRLNGSVRPSDWPREVGNYHSGAGKLYELGHLEEVKVVTRSPLVNQRRDHYESVTTPNPLFTYPSTVLRQAVLWDRASPPRGGACRWPTKNSSCFCTI